MFIRNIKKLISINEFEPSDVIDFINSYQIRLNHYFLFYFNKKFGQLFAANIF
jgi:hypothetical protein